MKNMLISILLVATTLQLATSSIMTYPVHTYRIISLSASSVETSNVAEQVRPSIDNTTSVFQPTSSMVWEYSIYSTHFTVYYNQTGSNGVTYEYAENVSTSLENSWTAEVDIYGFSAPPDSPITVYIMELVGDYGLTNGEYYIPPVDEYHVANITIDRNMGVDLLNYVSAHELFHAIQLSYGNTANWFIQDTENWVIEGTAVWMGSMVYPEYTGAEGAVSYVDYANDYMLNPDRTISELEYEAVLFWIFLYEQHGGFNTIESVMQQDKNLNAIQAVNATLNGLGTTFTEVFKEWTIANFLKDSYYSNGGRFNPIHRLTLPTYNGGSLPLGSDVADWGVDYFEISSSVILMPVLFEGEQSHNVTKILVEHDPPLLSDFPLNSSYIAYFPLMHANSLDKIVIIIRSLGDETSNNRVDYTLSFLGSALTLKGPYELASSDTTIIVTNMSSSKDSTALISTIVSGASSPTSSETPQYVRIPADVNSDRIIDIFDIGEISAHWYPGPPIGPLGFDANADVNNDGAVDIFDIGIVSSHWGESW